MPAPAADMHPPAMPAATGDDREDVAAPAEAGAPRFEEPPAAGDDEMPAGPSEAEESAFLAEARERGETPRPVTVDTPEEPEPPAKTLPPLSELVGRIPAEVRDTLEELFRARFVSVKRVPRKALKAREGA